MKKCAFLFAGQGAQYIGMGKDLYETYPESRKIIDAANHALGFNIADICFNGPQEELTKTDNCQPAILTVTIAAFEAYKAVMADRFPQALCMAGLSLGEYSALVASGAFSFSDAVVLLRKRGQFMEEEALKKPGTMLSIIGLELDVVKDIAQLAGCEVANVNCPGQIVVSGSKATIEKAKTLATEKGAKMAVELQVSGAFHSSFMQGAGEKLQNELASISVNLPQSQVISNVTAKPFMRVDEIKPLLVRQVASSVLWHNTINHMIESGVEQFIEFGPGKVLKGLVRRISKDVEVINIGSRADIELAKNGGN